jgi:hypothetical protein
MLRRPSIFGGNWWNGDNAGSRHAAALRLLRAADANAGLSAAAIMGAADALHHNRAWLREPARQGPLLTQRGGGLDGVAERARARRARMGEFRGSGDRAARHGRAQQRR